MVLHTVVFVAAWVVGDSSLQEAVDNRLRLDLRPRSNDEVADLLPGGLLSGPIRREDLRSIGEPLVILIVVEVLERVVDSQIERLQVLRHSVGDLDDVEESEGFLVEERSDVGIDLSSECVPRQHHATAEEQRAVNDSAKEEFRQLRV